MSLIAGADESVIKTTILPVVLQSVPAGPCGQQGPAGLNGAAGQRGPRGHPGEPGGVGPRGLQGETGLRGVPGVGLPGAPGHDGAAGQRGPRGHPGEAGGVGPRGQRGETGLPGAMGASGPAGGLQQADLDPLLRNMAVLLAGKKNDRLRARNRNLAAGAPFHKLYRENDQVNGVGPAPGDPPPPELLYPPTTFAEHHYSLDNLANLADFYDENFATWKEFIVYITE